MFPKWSCVCACVYVCTCICLRILVCVCAFMCACAHMLLWSPTLDIVCVTQVLRYWATPLPLSVHFKIWGRASLSCPGWPWNTVFSVSVSWLSWFTGQHYQIQLQQVNFTLRPDGKREDYLSQDRPYNWCSVECWCFGDGEKIEVWLTTIAAQMRRSNRPHVSAISHSCR